MAEARRRREAALGVVGAVTAGALAASGFAVARADEPTYPTWQEVQRAKGDVAAAAAEAERITQLVSTLQDRADAAGRTAMIAAERFHRARDAEDAAREQHAELAAEADAAQAAARTSRMRAGLLAASAARGGDVDARLLLDAGTADDLLHRLSTVSQLSASTQAVYARALADRRQAEAAGAQADAAATVLADAAAESRTALDAAQQAGEQASAQVADEQQHADRLIAQLAALRGTSVRLAAAYVDGVRAARDAAPVTLPGAPTQAPAPTRSASPAPASTAPSASPPPAPIPSSAAPEPARTPSAAPTPVRTPSAAPTPIRTPSAAPAPVRTPSAAPEPVEPSPTPSAPPPASSTAGAPNSQQAASAVAFARDQIGDPYRFGGAGPDSWDCSGLTMQAYASVGVGIGGHSATAQFRLAAAEGRLLPYAQAAVGDLVFYTDGGGDMYHVAVYSGGGMMIEAPYPGTRVREVPVRSADRAAQVARPTG